MAGLFGFLNYDKEGPGISKNAPKKHTFIVFFETFFRNFWKFITINVVYCLCSIPILTNGLANAGITNVARNTARDKHSFGLSDFFETIKKNWKQGIIVGIINVIIYILLGFNIWFYLFQENPYTRAIGLGLTLSVLFIFTLIQYYMWTLMITFNYTVKQIYTNSFRFVFVNLWKNLLCLIVNLLIFAINIGLIILFFNSKFISLLLTFELLAYFLFYPCFNALLIQYCTFPSIKKYIIDPYYAEHPDEDLDKRHDLGLDGDVVVEETENQSENDAEEESDVIFED